MLEIWRIRNFRIVVIVREKLFFSLLENKINCKLVCLVCKISNFEFLEIRNFENWQFLIIEKKKGKKRKVLSVKWIALFLK